jgi:tellurite resistance protein
MKPAKKSGPADGVGRLDADDAFIALLIAAMAASGHVATDEAERTHNIIWSMRRFRNREGDAVGRVIERMRDLVDRCGAKPVIAAAAKAIPTRQHQAAFAVATDVVLVDGRLEPAEQAFLNELWKDLGLEWETARRIIEVIRVKNSA